MVSAHFSTNTLSSIVSTDTALVRAFVGSFVSPDDFAAGTLPGERQAIVERQLKTLVTPGTILRVEVRRPDGTVIFADDPALRGASAAPSDAFARAGTGTSAVVDIVDVTASGAAGPGLATSTVVREYFPLSIDGKVVGIVGVWRDAVPILAQLDEVRRNIVIVTLSAALVAAFVLFLVFRSAQGRITRQTQALIDSTQLDPLTGTFNHGALVDAVARSVDGARKDGTAVRGRPRRHRQLPAAQRELRAHRGRPCARRPSSSCSAATCRPSVILGRYGPDELLLVAPAGEIAALGVLLERGAHGARRPRAPVRHLRAAAADRQRRCLHVPGPRRVGDRPADDDGADPPGGQGQRRRCDPLRRPARRAGAGDAHVRRLPGPDLRGRHEGSIHQATLGRRRPLQRLPGRADGRRARVHPDHPGRRPVARRRQDRHPGPHPAQARQAHLGGVRDRPAARGARRPDRPRPSRRRADPRRRSATITSAGTGPATSTGWPAPTSRTSRGSWPSRTPSRR